jgi:CRP-like cAMP-binding protein
MHDNNPTKNRLLAALPKDECEFLLAHISPYDMVRGNVLVEMGGALEHVYFPQSGAISLVVMLQEGHSVESVMIGNDGVLGASAAAAATAPPSFTRAIVQLEGVASRVALRDFREPFSQCPTLRNVMLRYSEATAAQSQQSAACNVQHDVPARLARWLLKSRDLADSDELPLTQEFLADMLGVRRPSVTTAAQTLEAAGLISYSRGRIRITNLDGLRRSSCECYQTIKTYYHHLFPESARDHLQVVRPEVGPKKH